MRIVQLLTQSQGGPVDHAVDLARAYVARGHESHVVGPPGGYVGRLTEGGVRWHPAEVGGKGDVAGARRVTRVLGGLGPDVLHAQDRRAGLVGRIWARRAGIASVYTLHGVPDSLAALVPGNLSVAERRRTDRLAYLSAERRLARWSGSPVVTPCEAVATYARDHVRVPPSQVVVVPNGVAVGEPVAPRDAATCRAVWVGVMQPVKRVETLLRAAARVPGLRLRLVGDGPLRPELEALARELGLGDRVEFTGFVDDPVAQLHDADLFVLPSAAEACPLALLQAMAAGLPSVLTRVGGVPEIARDGREALLVPAGDDDGLTEALGRLVADRDLRTAMGAQARARVAEHFTTDACADRLLAVYEVA